MELKKSNSKAQTVASGVYRIEAKSEKNSALQKSGVSAILGKWNGDDNQKWSIEYHPPGYLQTEGYYIKTLNGKEVLNWDKDKNKVNIQTYSNNVKYTANWDIVNNGDGTFLFENGHFPNPVLTSNGINNSVNATTGNNSDKQKFYLTKDPLDPNIENSGSLVITSDPQYPWTDKTDDNQPETEDEKKSRSTMLIGNQYRNINDYTNTVEKSSILINGDITAFGHPWQRSEIKRLLKILKRPYYYGLGNHDIINNYNDCEGNRCANGSFYDYFSHVQGLNLPESRFDAKKDSSNAPYLFIYKGSFSYSIDFGKIYSIQLNCYPGMESHFLHTEVLTGYAYDMEDNIKWFENELKLAKNEDKAIIVNVHYYDRFSPKYQKLLSDYGVKAVFSGHYHKNAGRYSSIYSIPVFLSGSASQSTYLIVEYDNTNMKVYLVKNNDWRNKKLINTINIS